MNNSHISPVMADILNRIATPSSRIKSSVTFIPVTERFPVAEKIVLASISGGTEPTWPTYTDGSEWFDACTGELLEGTVTHWGEFPAGVNA